ncbi:MAG: hypothetical protein HYS57_00690 [Parcubacteria group bacterium]|nr:hypothetical protein [Parcubacteria group bacterium]
MLLAVLSILSSTAQAATLYFSPSSGTRATNATFTANIYVASVDQSMNAASGVISFPSDKLEVTSLSKTGSIFSLWVQEPSFSNVLGSVNFEGIVLNPGFIGSSGKILSITFRTKAVGNAPLSFSSGSILANDGKGTNILTGLGDAYFSIVVVQPGASEIISPVEIPGTPAAPEVRSTTHVDPNQWYTTREAKFTWDVPADVTGVRLLVGRIPTAIPTVTYTTPVNSKDVTDLTDGVWYFSVRLRNAQGWGSVSRFRFQIDTEKPTRFDIRESERKDLTDPRARFVFDASDTTSGIDYYEVQISNQSPQIWRDDGSHKHETSPLGPGKYTLIVKAVDKAGNSSANSAEFTVEALESPTITDYPKELASGEILAIKGETRYPDAQVTIFLQHEKDETRSYAVKSDNEGKFTFVAEDRLSSGIYTAWVEVRDARSAKSEPSEKIIIAIERPALLRIGSRALGFLAVAVPLIALVLLSVYLSWHWWHKFVTMRRRVKEEVREAEQALHRAFDLLKEAIREQIKMLEKTRTKRQLTEEEEKVVQQLKRDLDGAEELMKKELEDIERGVR